MSVTAVLSCFIFGFHTTHFSSGRNPGMHSRETHNEVRWKILSCFRYEFNPSFLSCEAICTEGTAADMFLTSLTLKIFAPQLVPLASPEKKKSMQYNIIRDGHTFKKNCIMFVYSPLAMFTTELCQLILALWNINNENRC